MRREAIPYHFGSPAGPDHFADRDEELALLGSRMGGAINVILQAPRRYGKTSLLKRAADLAGEDGVGVGYVNLLRCSSRKEVAQQLIQGILNGPLASQATARRVATWVERIRVRPRLDVRPDGWSVTFEPGLAERDWAGAMSDTCALLNESGKRRPLAMILDEFPQVAEIDTGLAGVCKGILDDCAEISWVVAGSHVHTMERLTTLPGAPLLNMGEVMRLGPVPEEAMVPFLVDRARVAGKELSDEVAVAIFELAGPVPNDIQRLAQHAFDVAEDRVDVESVQFGMGMAVSRQAETFAERYEELAPSQQRLLRLIADGPLLQPYARSVLDRVEVANDNAVRRALESLERRELVVRRASGWMVGDPFLGRWLLGEEGRPPIHQGRP